MSGSSSSSASMPVFFRRWWPGILVVLILVVALYIVFGREGGIIRVLEQKQENDSLKAEIELLRSESEELRDQIRLLEERDPAEIEEEARRKGMVREGETVYRLQYEETADSSNTGNPGLGVTKRDGG